MRIFSYNKLVRDKILGSMLDNGEKPEYHTLSDDEYRAELRRKLSEEAAELDLADLQEVIDCLAIATGTNPEDVRAEQARKGAKFGSFVERTFIDTVAIPEDSPWLTYLEANPDRYPEVTD